MTPYQLGHIRVYRSREAAPYGAVAALPIEHYRFCHLGVVASVPFARRSEGSTTSMSGSVTVPPGRGEPAWRKGVIGVLTGASAVTPCNRRNGPLENPLNGTKTLE